MRRPVAAILVGLAAAGCSDRAHRAGRQPIDIPAIHFPDAGDGLVVGEPSIDSPCPDSCALGACDGDICRRCLLAIDKSEDPDGRVLDGDQPLPLACRQMAPTARMSITASGEVIAPPACRSWRATLVLRRDDGVVFARIVIADTDPDHSVYLEGMAASSPAGLLAVRIELADLTIEPSDCGALRLQPGFTITIAPTR